MVGQSIRFALNTFAVALGLLGALLIAALVGPRILPALDFAAKKTIQVQGAAVVEVQSDKVQVSGAVTTSAKSAAEALDQNNTIMARILDGLSADGVGREGIRTTGFSITPQHPPHSRDSYGSNELITTGYVVKNSINVTLPVGQYSGKLLDRMIRLGATNIDSVSFIVDEAAKYNDQARALAAEDARHKAEVAAKPLGLRVGKVVSVDRPETMYPTENFYPKLAMAAPSSPPPSIEIIAREQTFTANLTVVFELE